MEERPMKIILGFFSFLLTCLAIFSFTHGEDKRLSAFVEKYEHTAHENRAAVADAYHHSWGVDEWSIASGVCLSAAIALVIAVNKLPKNRSSEAD
jgi:hypothetical protein